ncbi:hypothetical protein COCNU_scaffold019478G000010 [Cocos nucifera]|nr:hypothetical protein [Cocos nucifera]
MRVPWAGAMEQVQHVRRMPVGGPGSPRPAAATPTTPGGHPGKSHPGGSEEPSGIANGRGTGCASCGHRARGLRSGDTSPGPPCHCAWVGGLRARKMGHARAGRGHGSAKHGRRSGKEGEQNVGSAPEGGPGPCVRGAPYHPGGASGQAPPRGFRRTERHCKWAGDGIHVRWAWRSGLARREPKSLAAPPLRMPGRGRPMHAWSDRGQGSSAQGRRIAEVRRRTSAGRPREELGRATEATPTTPTGHPGKSHPGGSKGSSGIANGWVPGCASRGHGDRDLCSGVPNPLSDRPRAAVALPNTPTGHPDNPNLGGSKGPSGIANGRGTGCASSGHGA